MDYKEQIDQAKRAAEKWKAENPIVGVGRLRVDLMVDDLARSITDLLARAEAVEARCKRLDEARERANEACAKWEYRAEKAEKERDTYKIFFDDVSSKPDCNTCDKQYCEYRPNPGQTTRFNCPLWRGKKEE